MIAIEQAARIIGNRAEGMTLAAIAEAEGISISHAYRVILESKRVAGFNDPRAGMRGRRPGSKNRTEAELAALRARYIGGESLKEIARSIGVSPQRALRLTGPRERIPVRTEAEIETLRARYLNGETLEEIGASIGVTRERIRQLIKVGAKMGGATVRSQKRKLSKLEAAKLTPEYWAQEARKRFLAAGWRKCHLCGERDNPESLKFYGVQAVHPICNRKRTWAFKNGKSVSEYAPKPFGSWAGKNHRKVITEAVERGLIWCSDCQAGKEPEEFAPVWRQRRSGQCRACSNARGRANYQKARLERKQVSA